MDVEKFMLPCVNKKIFGFDCPGCGTQRSLIALFKGDFADAFYFFPAIYTSILLIIFLGLHFVDRSRNYTNVIIATAIGNAAIMIISYIYKMTNI